MRCTSECCVLINLTAVFMARGLRDGDGKAPRLRLQTPAMPAHDLTIVPAAAQAKLDYLTGIAEQRGTNFTAMGSSFQVHEEVLMLLKMGTRLNAGRLQTICEVGFNAGHSAALLLSGDERTVLHEFDEQTMPASAASFSAVSGFFPNRIMMHKGDSKETVPAFVESAQAAAPCDRFFIDGDHNEPGVSTDLANAILATREGGIIIADDTTSQFWDVRRAWHTAIRLGYVRGSKCIEVELARFGPRGFCYGIRALTPALDRHAVRIQLLSGHPKRLEHLSTPLDIDEGNAIDEVRWALKGRISRDAALPLALLRLGTRREAGERFDHLCAVIARGEGALYPSLTAAVLLLRGDTSSVLHAFDRHVPSVGAKDAWAEATRRFPSRVHMHDGDTKRALSAFTERMRQQGGGRRPPCDRFYVDGAESSHTANATTRVGPALMSAVRATRPWGIVMARLWAEPAPPLGAAESPWRAWQHLVQRGLLIDHRCVGRVPAASGPHTAATPGASDLFCYATRSGAQATDEPDPGS